MVSALDPRAALTACQRFGLGARPGDLAEAARDPRGFVQADLGRIPQIGTDLPSTAAALAQLFDDQERVKAERQRPATNPPAEDRMMEPGAASKPADMSVGPKIFRAEAVARLKAHIRAEVGFVERLVAFWSNHFAVSVSKGPFLRVTAGAFEREAIRPHVLGRFADMLRAVERHPAMLHYLDNQKSVGPNSRAGRNRDKGLNENLAREILELHTLGVGGGYRQADVTALARIITGWTIPGRNANQGEPGQFFFNANTHEPGAQTVLARRYGQEGEAQGEAVLTDLANAPATAQHVATKLVRHFVADQPPPRLVDRLAKLFLSSGGDLKAVALALIRDDEAWAAPATKLRSPQEYLVAMLRATGTGSADPGFVLNSLQALGHPLWQPVSPAGFPDTVTAWATPEAMKLRLDIAFAVAGKVGANRSAMDVLDQCLGSAASVETRDAVAHAETRQQALAILFMSPEFQRR